MLSNKNYYNLSFIIDLYNTHLIFVKLFYVFDHLSVASVNVMKKILKISKIRYIYLKFHYNFEYLEILYNPM